MNENRDSKVDDKVKEMKFVVSLLVGSFFVMATVFFVVGFLTGSVSLNNIWSDTVSILDNDLAGIATIVGWTITIIGLLQIPSVKNGGSPRS